MGDSRTRVHLLLLSSSVPWAVHPGPGYWEVVSGSEMSIQCVE